MKIEGTSGNFAREVLQNPAPALVDFWAPWCGPCVRMSPIIDEIAEEFDGRVKVVKVNVDENPELAVQYSVTSIPTLLLFAGGQAVDRVSGAVPKRALVERLNAIAFE